jgi:hypothetical protein
MYKVIVENASGCTAIDSIVVSSNFDSPIVQIAPIDTLTCAHSEVLIRAITMDSLLYWKGSAGILSSEISISVQDPGIYTAVVQGANGCKDSTDIEVFFRSSVINVGSIIAACEGLDNGQVEITDISDMNLPIDIIGLGMDRIEISTLPYTIDGLSSGDYMITIEDAAGCSAQEFITIDDDRSSSLKIIATSINQTGDFQLTLDFSATIAQVIWSDAIGLSCYDCANPVASVTGATTFNVTVIDTDGCSSMATIDLFYAQSIKVYLPNIVNLNSPNGNDKFYPQTNQNGLSLYDMDIYDRWGSLIHREIGSPMNDPNFGWNGMIKGTPAALGLYVYVLTSYDDTGEVTTYKGSMALIGQ